MASARHIATPKPAPELTEREELVLRYIVQHYILTANPVGSRYISKRLEEESVSAATIRNAMADLEEKGYISHPHTSAGRVPTDRGYRLYVDSLVRGDKLSVAERAAIRNQINPAAATPVLMKEVSRLIASISLQLGIVTAPELLDSRLERLELVPLSSTRLLVVLSLRARLIKTVTLEVQEEIPRERIDFLVQILNERFGGLTLREIRSSCRERLRDVVDERSDSLLKVLLDSSDRIFTGSSEGERIQISPTQNILRHPEFANPDQLRGIVELVENEEMVIHLLDGHSGEEHTVDITIGGEHGNERMVDYSLITTRYKVGTTTGTIGLIGPKRMNYSKMITVVEYIARTITDNFHDG
ncbi:MAG: heat-inducible transcriptional repressor HrcA [Bacteroidota bacterium]